MTIEEIKAKLSEYIKDDRIILEVEKPFPDVEIAHWIKIEDFVKLLSDIKAGKIDLVTSGWKKYFDKWRDEGIEF